MKLKSETEVLARLDEQILTIRGQKVILASDLAAIYGVETKVLNQAVKRNAEKFPQDFMFVLTRQEFAILKSQIVTSSWGGVRRALPYAFTEHGAMMAANVLNSPRAAQMSVFVVRAFVKMRAVFTDTRDLARKLAALEKELKGRLNVHEATIVTFLQRVLDILEPPPVP